MYFNRMQIVNILQLAYPDYDCYPSATSPFQVYVSPKGQPEKAKALISLRNRHYLSKGILSDHALNDILRFTKVTIGTFEGWNTVDVVYNTTPFSFCV